MDELEKKNRVIDILFETFYDNKSVNFVLKQDSKKDKRIRTLLEYSYFLGDKFGEIILTEDNSSCAIIIDPQKKRTTLQSLYWNIKIGIKSIGLRNLPKVLRRESILNKLHPNCPYVYLWYIGVNKNHQGNGKGTQLLNEITAKYLNNNRPIYLQTSTQRNFKLYEKLGFQLIAEPDVGYPIKLYLKK